MNVEEMIFCQCCGMPMQAAADFGTEADGTASTDYCVYCYKGGSFTQECTMEEMIRHCAQFHKEFKHGDGSSLPVKKPSQACGSFFRISNGGGNRYGQTVNPDVWRLFSPEFTETHLKLMP